MIPHSFYAYPNTMTAEFVRESKVKEHWDARGNAIAQMLGFWSLIQLKTKPVERKTVKKNNVEQK